MIAVVICLDKSSDFYLTLDTLVWFEKAIFVLCLKKTFIIILTLVEMFYDCKSFFGAKKCFLMSITIECILKVMLVL